jgi:hypothetical protein
MVECVIDFIHILTFCIWSFKCQFSIVAGALFKCPLQDSVVHFSLLNEKGLHVMGQCPVQTVEVNVIRCCLRRARLSCSWVMQFAFYFSADVFHVLFRDNRSCHYMLLGLSTICCFPSDPVHVPGFSCHDAGVVEQDPIARVSVVLCCVVFCSCQLCSQMWHSCSFTLVLIEWWVWPPYIFPHLQGYCMCLAVLSPGLL